MLITRFPVKLQGRTLFSAENEFLTLIFETKEL